MPKELKKRGRREEKKRKRLQLEEGENVEEDHTAESPKRQKQESDFELLEDVNDGWEAEQGAYAENNGHVDGYEFYGLLGEDDQAYFKHADQLLELNQFADAEERNLFLANVWREAHGKELKIASSQSCSRFMEKLIRVSSPTQLKALFQTFTGHFLSLVQHRFASHCCETLFLQCAHIVTDELIAPIEAQTEPVDNEEVYISMENLFLYTVDELAENMGYLMTDNFASHTLRVLLVVLSGRPLEGTSTSSLLHSKNKEKVEGQGRRHIASSDDRQPLRSVPDSFYKAIGMMTASTVGGLDTNSLRALATQPLGNPVIQLLLEIEFSVSGKQKARDEKSLFRRLLPDDPLEEETPSAAFLKGLLYDPVGSRLLESIVQHAPGKVFKSIYRTLFHDNLGRIVRNEIAGFVVAKSLARLSHDDLEQAINLISPEIPNLLANSRVTIVKTLVERSRVRGVDTRAILDALNDTYGKPGISSLSKLLQLDLAEQESSLDDKGPQKEANDPRKLHSSLLVQAMLEEPDVLRIYIMESLSEADFPILLSMARDKTATHVLQKSLICREQSKVFRRKIILEIVDHAAELAVDPVGSHVVDAIWSATEDLQYLRERIADVLVSHETELRDSFSGRAVWRNWMLDLYKRRKADWIARLKEGHTEKGGSKTDRPAVATPSAKPKTALELARERFAASKHPRTASSIRILRSPATAANKLVRLKGAGTATAATVAH